MRRTGVALGLALILALGGCATRVPQPAMVAQVQPSGFGYSETRLAAGRYEVRYQTPDVSLPADEDRRAGAVADQKQRAYDLALWRTAQIALAEGYSHLKVEQEHRDAVVTEKREYLPVASGPYGAYGPGGMLYPGWAYGPRFYYGQPGFGPPFWFYDDPFAYETKLIVSGQIKVLLLVDFAKATGPDAMDAAATAKRLAAQYAGAAY